MSDSTDTQIAIVGMALRVPGARTLDQFWQNLTGGVESITTLSDQALLDAGESAARLNDPNYVKASGVLEGFDTFDADFFGFSPKEAAIMDPQHRQFLECAVEALDDAGHPPSKFDGSVGVFGGCGMGSYLYFNLCTRPDLVDTVGLFLLRHTGNDKDFLVTRLSYLLDLDGPAVNVQTACSTSAVATHLAAQSLLAFECDMALAGGVTIEIPHGRGYMFREGEVLSPDGHCHAFDHRGQGTVFGSGAGVVVLRRLEDALRDGDRIYAVIRGSAINNDGARKVGYLAPSVDGQAAACAEAMEMAGVEADSIGYVECHGTGTAMGDPIEIEALSQAFRRSTDARGFCRVGSVKTNIGHLDTAAGVAGLIKAALSLHHEQLPPSLNYDRPNPNIPFERSAFVVNDRLTPWPRAATARRAALNSLGVGGTNAHLILEEAPARPPRSAHASGQPILLGLSAKSRPALDAAAHRLADHLEANPTLALEDVGYTLLVGREAYDERRVLAAASPAEAIALLRSGDRERVFTHRADRGRKVSFMFPGGGSQYSAMAAGLYRAQPVFRDAVDRGLELAAEFEPSLGLRRRLFEDPSSSQDSLRESQAQLPAIFIIEYALAMLWRALGVEPEALVGHSLGENTAACLAGVMNYRDCLGLVILRGQLLDTAASGAMLSVATSVDRLTPLLGAEVDLGIVNGPDLCVATGATPAIEALEARLSGAAIEHQRLRIDIAAHSRHLDGVLDQFQRYLEGIALHPPEVPLLSNLSGTWMTDEQATSPRYWTDQLRHTIRFGDCMETLLGSGDRVFVECGPGRALCSLARIQKSANANTVAVPSLRHPEQSVDDHAYFLSTLGRLWGAGVDVSLDGLFAPEARKVSLPSYAFQSQRYFIEPGARTAVNEDGPRRIARFEDWFYEPVWRPSAVEPATDPHERNSWLVFLDDAGIASQIADRLQAEGHSVVRVRRGDTYLQRSDDEYLLSPERGAEGYQLLLRDLVAAGRAPDRIGHFWLVTPDERYRPGSSFFHRTQEQGFYSLLFLAQALAEHVSRPAHLSVISSGMQAAGRPLDHPEKATVLGPCLVIPREFPNLTVRAIDVVLGREQQEGRLRDKLLARLRAQLSPSHDLVDRVEDELLAAPGNEQVALRDGQRLTRGLVKRPRRALEPVSAAGEVVLITGGLGGVGGVIADHLAHSERAKLVLVGRSAHTSRMQDRVRALEATGAQVMLQAADVTDVVRMRAVFEAAEARFGRIDIVVHAAGVVNDALISLKRQSEVEEVFAPKVHGTAVIRDLLAARPHTRLILFSSTSTAIAPPGQVDYVAANAYLNAVAEADPNALAIDWGIWADVGMAARATRVAPAVEATPIDHPLFDRVAGDDPKHLFASLEPGAEWMLSEHRTKAGHALLPGTGFVELAGQALGAVGEQGGFQVDDMFFFRPLSIADGEARLVRVALVQSDEGYGFEVRSQRSFDGRSGWELHAQARLRVAGSKQAAPLPLDRLDGRMNRLRLPFDRDGIRSGQEDHLNFGPRWRVLRQASYGRSEALGELVLPEMFSADLERYRVHPALLDIATGFAMPLIEGYSSDRGLWVPLSYQRIRVHRDLPARVFSWVRGENHVDDQFASFDVVIADEAGEVLVEVEGLTLKRVSQEIDFALAAKPSPTEIELEGARQNLGDQSPAERSLRRNVALGIHPAEGARVFDLARSGDAAVVYASSIDLPALVDEAERQSRVEVTRFSRPELASTFLAPRDEVERTLAGFWQDLLGVDEVGVEDSFFDLGGHSLIAVRLFAKIKKAYQVDYPISVLFEAPTVASCAQLLKQSIGSAERAAPSTTVERRFVHLVPMHRAESSSKAPFFLVAGMFGNVLNLRHLAHLLGGARSFYGLQARGLYGDHRPHARFEEMARDYIAEMRVVQPHGPYFIGGFSGGGITAYEISQQLLAAGEEVALLVMLDSPTADLPEIQRNDRMQVHLHRIRRRGLGYLGEWVRERADWELGQLKARFDGEPDRDESEFHNEAIERAFREALAHYIHRRYPGRVTLFRPKLDRAYEVGEGRVLNEALDFVFDDNGWRRYAKEVEIHEVPGDHDSMVLEPNVRVLAARLADCIEAAEDALCQPPAAEFAAKKKEVS